MFTLDNCSCDDYIDSNGYGNCQKPHPDTNNLVVCYVKYPSNCSDAKDISVIRPRSQRQISTYACK